MQVFEMWNLERLSYESLLMNPYKPHMPQMEKFDIILYYFTRLVLQGKIEGCRDP